jgi:LysM repeat protein
MSAVEGLPAPTMSADPEARPRPGALPSLCPYLGTPDGSWRSAAAVREHRCLAVNPPVALAPEKQRRLCLVAAHTGCATYGAAMASRDGLPHERSANRPVARMTPVILDHGRFDLRMPEIHADRASGQAVLVGVLAIALVAILVARPSGGAGATGPGPASPSTNAADSTQPAAVASPSQAPEPTDTVPSVDPLASTDPAVSEPEPSSAPSASTAPATSGATYKVKSGDTLSAIAARFDTTVRVLVDLNGIADPSRLRVGQVLKLP